MVEIENETRITIDALSTLFSVHRQEVRAGLNGSKIFNQQAREATSQITTGRTSV
jgi:hypothetical protein